MFTIILQEKSGDVHRFIFDKPEVIIGRYEGNDIVLNRANVSKRHVKIIFKDGNCIIIDLKSSNGTFVNGHKITGPVMLQAEDKIYVGDFILSVEISHTQNGAYAQKSGEIPPQPIPPPPSAISPTPKRIAPSTDADQYGSISLATTPEPQSTAIPASSTVARPIPPQSPPPPMQQPPPQMPAASPPMQQYPPPPQMPAASPPMQQYPPPPQMPAASPPMQQQPPPQMPAVIPPMPPAAMAPKPQGSSAPAGPAPVAVGGSVLHPPAPSVPSLTEPKAQMAESPVYTGRMTPAAVGIPAEKKPMAASVVDTGDQPSDKISSELSKKRTKAKPDVKENLGLRRERDRSKQESVDIMDEERATSRMAVYGSPQHFRSPSIADPMLSNTGPDEQAELRRKGVVRYYRQMNPHKLFPLLVSIIDAQRYIKHTDLPGVTHAESDTALTIQQKSPRVRIVPILPGCTIYPPELEVDVRSEKVDAEFWLTPQVEGDLRNSARVQIWYQGELQDQIPIPCQIRAQTLTKISAFFSVISPVTGAFLENYGTQAANNGEGKLGAGGYVLQKLLSLLSSSGIWIGIFFLLIAFLCYLWLRPKRGDDVEQFLKTDLH